MRDGVASDMRSLLTASLALATLTSGCAPVISCTMIGCQSGYFKRFALDESVGTLKQLVVEVCKNGKCATSTMTAPPPKLGMGTAARLDNPDVSLGLSTEATGYRLTVSYYGGYQGSRIQDGDSYSVTATDQNGRRLASARDIVDYVPFTPNGKQCPPVCMMAKARSTP